MISIARNKAVGYDLIPGEMYKDLNAREELKYRLTKHFENYISSGKVPNYFMASRLILLSKTNQEYTDIKSIRPISILPSITKLFEVSIIHNLENATNSILFNKKQRGFMKGSSTIHNIQDVLAAAKSLQERRNHDKSKTGTIVFFDLTKAYDMLDRDILIQKLLSFSIPFNIISTIKDMLDKFTFTFEGQHIKTERRLVQGSVLSPILFNLYINDLM